MPIADSKKCQTLINVVAEEVQHLKALDAELVEGVSRLERCRQLFQAQGVSPVGTPLDGHLSQISAWIDSLRAVADGFGATTTSPVAEGFLAHHEPTHRNMALGEEI